MKNLILILIAVVITLMQICYSQAPEKDPYVILEQYLNATGGLEKYKSLKSIYLEAELSYAGLKGTIKDWTVLPDFKRQEIDIKIFKQISGDNGQAQWLADANGKVRPIDDDVMKNERKIEKLMANYDHVNRDSRNFTLFFEGIEKFNDKDCYVIKITNRINKDVRFDYINCENFYIEKTSENKLDNKIETFYSNYRKVNDFTMPFYIRINDKSAGSEQILEIKEYQFNQAYDKKLFNPPGDIVDYEFANGLSAEDILFVYSPSEHILLNVNLNGDEKPWILDSGASSSCIDLEYAASLGFKLEGSLQAQGTGKTTEASFLEIPSYAIQGIKFEKQKIAAIDIRGAIKRIGVDAYGILGYDFLSRFVTKIDYANKTISFYHPEKFVYAGEGVVFNAPLDNDNYFNIPATVDGKYSGLWSLDIGGASSSFYYPYAVKNGLVNKKGIKSIGGGAGGFHEEKHCRFKSMEIADYFIENPVIRMPVENGEGSFFEERIAGNMGNDVFKQFVIYLDYKNQRVIFEKGADFGRSFPKRKDGMVFFVNDNNKAEIYYVIKGTAGEKAGFKKGDFLVAIDGKNVEEFGNIQEIYKLFKEKEGTVYKLAVERNGKIIEKRLKLKAVL